MQVSGITNHAGKSYLSRKHLVVVQCRYKSTRLPGKAMMMLGGIPMLSFLLKRLKAGLSENSFKVILATTEKAEDDIVADLGKQEEVEVLRGDENDLLKRYIQCLEVFPADIVVRVTGDNPFTCPEVIECAVNEMIKRKVDYLKCENLPVGGGVDIFSFRLLKQLDKQAKDLLEREHINLYVLRNKEKFTTYFFKYDGKLAHPSMSITVDTIEDLENIRSILKPSDIGPWRLSLLEALKRMDPSII